MTNTEVKQTNKVNLSTYYILPLLKLNKQSWGSDNLIKTQVTKYGEVVVFIKDSVNAGDYYNHENYGADVDEEDGSTMIIYNIPERFLEDYQFFIESKYSKMSIFAKDAIKQSAKANGLQWGTPTGKKATVMSNGKQVVVDIVDSSEVLLALDKNEDLKKSLEKELDIKIMPEAELWSRLNEELEFIKLD